MNTARCTPSRPDVLGIVEADLSTLTDTEDKHYTYTIITTDSNKQLKFLHDRMPVILDPGSAKMKTWLDPGRHEWSKDLQDILTPFDGELEVYPVSKDVGKVGNNSPTFIIPIASRENKSNIANFFANAQSRTTASTDSVKKEEICETPPAGTKRKAGNNSADDDRPSKKEAMSSSPTKAKAAPSPNKAAVKLGKTISSTSNGTKSPAKGKAGGTPKITKFFGNSA